MFIFLYMIGLRLEKVPHKFSKCRIYIVNICNAVGTVKSSI